MSILTLQKPKNNFKTRVNPLKNLIILVCFISFYYPYNMHIVWYSNIRDNVKFYDHN